MSTNFGEMTYFIAIAIFRFALFYVLILNGKSHLRNFFCGSCAFSFLIFDNNNKHQLYLKSVQNSVTDQGGLNKEIKLVSVTYFLFSYLMNSIFSPNDS